MSSHTDVELALVAAQAGAAVVRDRYGAEVERFAKDADDFATNVDIEAEQAILGVLRAARPEDTVQSEESGRTGALDAERIWLVDPLCGTRNYAVRNVLVSVNVALRTGKGVIAAAVADPFTGEVFWTDGDRAWLRWGRTAGFPHGPDRPDAPLVPSAESRLVEVNLDPPFPNAPRFRAVRLLADPGFNRRFHPRVVSTTLAVAWVAAGRRAGYVTDGVDDHDEHFAAGIALCQAAGCVVTGIEGQPVHKGVGGLVMAADRDTHTDLLALIRSVG